MQKIWMFLENQNVFVYVIAGVCIWGILSKLFVQGKLGRLLSASEKMGTTTQRQLRTLRNHYENSLHMDLQVHNIHAFVDKHLMKLKLCGIPIRIWDSMTIEAALLVVATGGIGIVNVIHEGLDEQMLFRILLATIISCACLLSVENIFRVENSYDRLQANIEDYLENNLKNRLGRPLVSRQTRSQRQAAVAMEDMGASYAGGQAESRPGESDTVAESRKAVRSKKTADSSDSDEFAYADIPEYEIREQSQREVAAGQEAEVVAQVLRNFFSS